MGELERERGEKGVVYGSRERANLALVACVI